VAVRVADGAGDRFLLRNLRNERTGVGLHRSAAEGGSM
jgi:hypothetical protein